MPPTSKRPVSMPGLAALSMLLLAAITAGCGGSGGEASSQWRSDVDRRPADGGTAMLKFFEGDAACARLEAHIEDSLIAAHADKQVRVFATMQMVDFTQETVDLAIRYGRGGYDDLEVEKLMDEQVFPACAPALRDGPAMLRAPADLPGVPLIHDDADEVEDGAPTWAMWLNAAGVGHPDPERGLHFNQSALAIEAAAAGKGVVLAKAAIAAADLAAGRLVRLFDDSQPIDFGYYLVAPEPQWRQKKVQAFIAWLRAEVAAAR